MNAKAVLDGYDLKNLFHAGADWLETIIDDINALNVFPVPDGDTGTNMVATLRASLEAAAASNGSVASVAYAIDKGALMGARGNSGVILSQILHGMAEELKGKEIIDADTFARALENASDTAYTSLTHPVEGTMLTVIRDAASAARKSADTPGATFVSVLTAAVHGARASVMETPGLLPVLKEAGVVDAGGHGLFTFLEGALLHISSDGHGRVPELLSHGRPLVKGNNNHAADEIFYGFCTQFMIEGENLKAKEVRETLENLGESLIVIGDESTLRVHIHTKDTESVMQAVSPFGTVTDIEIGDMDEQHQDFLMIRQCNQGKIGTAVIAVVNGPGMVNVFADLGIAAVVPGGQTMNPSTMDILQTVEKVDSDNVIILPNNKNVISTALLVRSLTEKTVTVIPTKTVPQGISAMVEYVPEADYQSNIDRMTAGFRNVKTIEITTAINSVNINNLDIKQGDVIGLLDGKLIADCTDAADCILKICEIIDLAQYELVTVYYGKDINKAEAEEISRRINEQYPDIELGLIDGEQPHYRYIISVE